MYSVLGLFGHPVEEPAERTATSSTDSGSNNASIAGNIARQQIIDNFF